MCLMNDERLSRLWSLAFFSMPSFYRMKAVASASFSTLINILQSLRGHYLLHTLLLFVYKCKSDCKQYSMRSFWPCSRNSYVFVFKRNVHSVNLVYMQTMTQVIKNINSFTLQSQICKVCLRIYCDEDNITKFLRFL